MARAHRREQLWASGLFALATLVIVPVFWRGLPCSDDTLPHFYRAIQLDVLLRQGAPFLQWGPDLLRGYGYPIFAFYAPYTYWLLQAIHLFGVDFGAALQVAFLLGLWLAGWGAYRLARRYLAPPAAFVAGLAYLFAPYVLYDAIQRGALPELLALAFLPWALEATIGAQAERGRTIVVAALWLGLLVLTHNVVSIFGLALAVALAVADLPFPRPRGAQGSLAALWHGLWPASAAVTLALGLSAFFWLPALAELTYTQSRRPDPPFPDWPRFEQHLAPPASLLSWPEEPADPDLLNPPISRALGMGQAGLALLGLPALLGYRGAPRRRRQLLVWGTVLLGSLFFASTLSSGWWQRLEPLKFIQLPTRFLGPASLGAALLAGVAVQWLGKWGRRPAASTLLLAAPAMAVAVSGWSWLYPDYCPVPEEPTQAALAQATTWSRWYAEAQAELLPRWVDQLPPADALIAAYQDGRPVNRLSLPTEGQLLAWETGPGWDRYRLQLPQRATLRYQTFYFPGWSVWVDDEPQPLTITAPDGLFAFPVPPGEHIVVVAFRRTLLRGAMLVVSTLFALLAIVLAWRLGREPQEPTTSSKQPFPFGNLLVLALLLPILKIGVIDHLDTAVRASRFDGSRLQGVTVPADANFGGELRYLGYSAPEEVVSGDRFPLTQYWSALQPLGVPYGFSVRVASDDGSVWNLPPQRPFSYADYPATFTWAEGQYARDAYAITLLPGTPPGDYWIEASAFRRDLDLSLAPQGILTGPDPAQARVGRIRVLPARTGADLAELDAARAAVDVYRPVSLATARLLGWSLPDFPIRAGEQAPLTLLWHAPPEPVAGPGTFNLTLLDAAGAVHASSAIPYGSQSYPPSTWAPGTLVRQQLRWRLLPATSSGTYTLQLDGIALGSLTVAAPERTFAPPSVAVTMAADMGIARLAGYTLDRDAPLPGATLPLALSWQVLAETEISYRVFVHLRDETGAVRAQSDAVPQSWARPTIGWLPGEYVLDTHNLALPGDLPAGAYDLFVGLYDPATGERLGETHLTKLVVE